MDNFYNKLFEAANIPKGAILDVTSDLFSVMLRFRELGQKFDANLLLDALKQAVGEEGTILIRTFNWDFCHNVPFNYKTTPSRVGILGNAALKRPDFKRTRHALYSWCVWGKEQKFFTETDPEDSFGEGSIFALLEEKNAYLLRIGDTQVSGLTSLHRSEQRANIPVRFIKKFTGQYIDENGKCQEKTYSMFVRSLDYDIRPREEVLTENFIKKNVITRNQYNGVRIDLIDLKKAGDAIYEDILCGKWADWVECSERPPERKGILQ